MGLPRGERDDHLAEEEDPGEPADVGVIYLRVGVWGYGNGVDFCLRGPMGSRRVP